MAPFVKTVRRFKSSLTPDAAKVLTLRDRVVVGFQKKERLLSRRSFIFEINFCNTVFCKKTVTLFVKPRV